MPALIPFFSLEDPEDIRERLDLRGGRRRKFAKMQKGQTRSSEKLLHKHMQEAEQELFASDL
jgi:hypothetical protein